MNASTKRVLLGMSGGTDSSMAAMLLKEQGYEVVGITLLTFANAQNHWPQFVNEAKMLAHKLEIEHHVMDVRLPFEERVVNYFTSEYQKGRTPNPCVLCNVKLKWDSLIRKADELRCDYVATGHYARIVKNGSQWFIAKGADSAKDQSYFLWQLPQAWLSRTLFPLGNFHKSQVKLMAQTRGFNQLATKRESMGVCFLQNKEVSEFLKERLGDSSFQEGVVVNLVGQVIGTHRGIPYYTIGQKKGLHIQAAGSWCVGSLMPDENIIVAVDPQQLFVSKVRLTDFYFQQLSDIINNKVYQVRIRGIDKVPFHEATIKVEHDELKVTFLNPVWAVTPGQSLVVYDGEKVIGGGIVDEV